MQALFQTQQCQNVNDVDKNMQSAPKKKEKKEVEAENEGTILLMFVCCFIYTS